MVINSDLVISGTNRPLKEVKFNDIHNYILCGPSTAAKPAQSNPYIHLDTIYESGGDAFTLTNGKVKVNKDAIVRVSGGVFWESWQNAGYIWPRMGVIPAGASNFLNRSGFIAPIGNGFDYSSSNFGSTIMSVSQNDQICISVDNPSKSSFRPGRFNTWLLVEVID